MDHGAGRGGSGRPCAFFRELTEQLCDKLTATLELDTPGEDGITPRVHYEQARRSYEEPVVPAAGEHIWGWFVDLHQVEVLTYGELLAWKQITGAEPSVEEVEALRALFRTRQEFQNGR